MEEIIRCLTAATDDFGTKEVKMQFYKNDSHTCSFSALSILRPVYASILLFIRCTNGSWDSSNQALKWIDSLCWW